MDIHGICLYVDAVVLMTTLKPGVVTAAPGMDICGEYGVDTASRACCLCLQAPTRSREHAAIAGSGKAH